MSLRAAPTQLRAVAYVIVENEPTASRNRERVHVITVFPTPDIKFGDFYGSSITDHTQVCVIKQAPEVHLELVMRYPIWNFEQGHLSTSTKAPFFLVILLALFKRPRVPVKEWAAGIVLLPVIFKRQT